MIKRALISVVALVLLLASLTSCALGTADAINTTELNVQLNSMSQSTPAYATTRAELLTPLNNDFRSRTYASYENVNGKTVEVYGLYRDTNERGNNPNFAQAVLAYQCIKYKEKYPERDVSMSFSSFHLSVAFSACVVAGSAEYGHTKNLYDCDYDSDGYYRLSYLLVWAAKVGIRVTVIGQIDAAGVKQGDADVPDFSFVEYFNSHLGDEAAVQGKTVGDFMTFREAAWKSYGDKDAADMMHNKLFTVSNYIDNGGVEHGSAIWTGSINLDGVNDEEINGNNSIQTGVVISGHEQLRLVAENFLRLMSDYCSQEDIVPFRERVRELTNEQVPLILAGKQDEIPKDEAIIYLGTENDGIFELYFTPLGGDFSTWDTVYNPYAKYLDKLIAGARTGEYIEFIWNNVKFNRNFELSDMVVQAVGHAFLVANNKDSLLELQLPGLDASEFDAIVAGENVGIKAVNKYGGAYHTKDFQLSYMEDGERKFVTVLNSLNFHEGSAYHQTNTFLVIKESETTGNNFYVEYASMLCPNLDFLSRRVVN